MSAISPWRLQLRLVLSVLAAVALTLGLAALPAAAHSELVSSSPSDGAALDAAPVAVELTFNEEISDAGLQVVAQGPQGEVPLGTAVITGPQVSVPWPQGQAGGTYTVAYRVVSADGHPINGTLSFSYAGAAASPGGSASEAAAGGGASASASPTYVDQGQAAVSSASPVAAESAEGDSGFPLWVPVLVVLAGVGVGAGVAYALRARRNAN